MTSADIRRSFVDFFVAKGHLHLPGASLVPDALSTTLFTIAGMEPFVPQFLGEAPPPAPRVVTVQRCLRVAGGKNDIDSVGRSGRHGTFLEMLGNFSFGDYYKREAIAFAWEYLTRTLSLPADRLYATVYVDDDEAAEIWQRDIGLPPERISRFREDNFWDMGPTGPCGPCSEIFYDLGESVGCGKETCGVGCPHCNRYIEVWNLVFQQYDRDSDGTLHPLPKQGIDTGMGFERLCMVLAGKTSIFDTDLYQSIIDKLPKDGPTRLSAEDRGVHRRIIADHARSCVFLVADGVTPSNTDRGYVLRFLARRAIRSGKLLGFPDGFFSRLTPVVVDSLASGYPELRDASERVQRTLEAEERQFGATLARGSTRLSERLDALRSNQRRELSGKDAFELYDTYGFPVDLTREIASEAGVSIDMVGYHAAMDEQRERARADALAKRGEVRVARPTIETSERSVFVGYEGLDAKATIVALFDRNGAAVQHLENDEHGAIVLDQTPFYAERGGQSGDRGAIASTVSSFDVRDTQYEDKAQRRIVHRGVVRSGAFAVGDQVDALVDPHWRREIRRHHTVTHLLQRALKEVLGDSVVQRGSAVFPERTRFDFDSPVGALSRPVRTQVTDRVNELIRSDYHVSEETMPFAAAIARGAVYMKGENYGDVVRVVSFGPSVELCGGTHVDSTGEIGHFVLLAESAIGAGIRRVEGVVSEAADRYVLSVRDRMDEVGSALSTSAEHVPEAVERLTARQRELERRIETLQAQLAAQHAGEYAAAAKEVAGVRYVALEHDDATVGARDLAESIQQKLPDGVVVIAAPSNGKVSLVVAAGGQAAKKGVSAKDVLAALMPHIDGKGGGNPAIAQGAGKNAAGINAALAAVPAAIEKAVRG
ncbi:MAG TPA: alanine--tRNA ligase [Candidatus Binatus sp.]|nr:alanine--tRNA ligase [Candidatus Binatus sp.]